MTLRELSAQYERSAQLLRVRISELRRQMNELAELTAHYYERGYDRNEGYRV